MRGLLLALLLLLPINGVAQTSSPAGGTPPSCAGDLSGTYPNCQVTASHLAAPLPTAQGGSGNATGAPSGAAGGDLAGTYPNPTAPNQQRVLCSIRGANFNSTGDQPCALPASVTAWAPTAIWVTNCTGTFTLAAGGVYPAASKGGTALVAATQVYTAVTGSTVIAPLTLAATIATTRMTVGTLYLSLTTAAGSAASCDLYVTGLDLT